MSVPLATWIATVEDDYLRQFITKGGAAVKFAVVSSDDVAMAVEDELRRLAHEANCQFANVSAASTRIHMIDQFFFEIARQMDWDVLVDEVVKRALREQGYYTPDSPHELTYRHIAEANDITEGELRRDIRKQLQRIIHSDFAMAQEFRIAMVCLAQARLEPDDIALSEKQSILDWLCGNLRLISSLRSAMIFQKIARHNARDMFLSLAHWLRVSGNEGLLLVLDMRQYLLNRQPHDGTLYHSVTTILDSYEVLRQFIDTTDELEGCFIAVIVPPAFLDDARRGLERYAPLQTRIWNEVHDRHRANPLSSLVRLSSEIEPTTGAFNERS